MNPEPQLEGAADADQSRTVPREAHRLQAVEEDVAARWMQGLREVKV